MPAPTPPTDGTYHWEKDWLVPVLDGLTDNKVATTDTRLVIPTTGAPASTVGSPGQYAIDYGAQVIYGPKGATTWPAGRPFQGSNTSAGVDAGTPVVLCRETSSDPWTLGYSTTPADFAAIRAAKRPIQFQSPDAAKPNIGTGASDQRRWDSWLQFPTAAYDPSTIPGLLYYWDPNTFGAADDSAVASLAPTNGSVSLVQATAARQPTIQTLSDGMRVIRFTPDGTAANDDELLATITAQAQPVSVAIVHSVEDTVAQQVLDGGVQFLNSTTAQQMFAGSTMNKTTSLPDALGVTVGVFNGASSKLYRNGGAPVIGNPGASGLTTTFRIGRHGTAGRPLKGDVGPIAVFSGALTQSQVQALGAGLAGMYSTAAVWSAVTG